MKRLPISADTAVKLAAFMKVPLEHLMHMPQHALIQKLAEMAKQDAEAASGSSTDEPQADEA